MFENTKAFSGFSVDDIPTAKQFYNQVLGIPLTEADGMLHLHIAGGTEILVYSKGPAHRAATFTILNFPVPDIEAAVKQLKERGVAFEQLPGVGEDGINRSGGPLIAWFKDPAGNWLSVIQE
ncbi:MAG: VOC family protein [Catenulispora sp.]